MLNEINSPGKAIWEKLVKDSPDKAAEVQKAFNSTVGSTGVVKSQ